MLRLCTLNRDRSNKRKWFYAKKAKGRQYPTEAIIDEDYADYLVLLASAPAQPESLLHSLKQGSVGISHHVNASKTEYKCFKEEGATSTLSDRSLKLVGNLNTSVAISHLVKVMLTYA